MELFYEILLAVLVLLAAGVISRQDLGLGSGQHSSQFKWFRNNYLLMYSLAMLGDWLQGPFVYALYESYGYKMGDIGFLFTAGFGSSLVFGTLVGSLGDRYGRRTACIGYTVVYGLSCLTKHSPNFWVLLLGRVLGGIGTSLLFSAFESWVVAEHFARGYSEAALKDVFSWAVFLGNGLMAILAGLLGNCLVEGLGLGRVAPFDFALLVLAAAGVLIGSSWTENYGEKPEGHVTDQFKHAWEALVSDHRLALLGAMQSLFEASMYSFVFLWTPALSAGGQQIPHGMIFACFMTSCMVGSASASLLMKGCRIERYMQTVFGVAAASLAVPFWCHLTPASAAGTSGLQVVAFCVFECCVGIFWPSFMKLRADYLPDGIRSTIINFFRVPLNLFVCLVLSNVEKFSVSTMFGLTVIMLGCTLLCQMRLEAASMVPSKAHVSPSSVQIS